ncbi:uncharacterized protein PHACADRAFT_208146 [Phanerochaete carnosa HHB-10118-sp]|uniref:Uncharacterized protein n=1 Tax=Phanerochaete carnosa (strain HHB-10118-sp) TaxID=650164 RepID=K5VZH2_PHACS|nr:uncharacterized protein PHACADRAFT_208146 [Phanerochaete carnosa HHB-10118-sp]EKM56978.1 hypothetical protein PHACADRAFT_208146 [Phanerochaete carnosa HHB-10118-sp]
MSADPENAFEGLRDELNISEDEFSDSVPSEMLQSLLVRAIRAKDPEQTLGHFRDAVNASQLLYEMDVVAAIPILLPLSYATVNGLLDIISTRCNAKELVVAAQECTERLQGIHCYYNESDDDTANIEASLGRQTERLLKIYTQAIPRLRKGKQTSEDILKPIFSQLNTLLSHNAPNYTPQDAQDILLQTAELVRFVAPWAADSQLGDADPPTDMFYKLITHSLEVFANQLDAGIAQRAFEKQYPRLIMPNQESSSELTGRGCDIVHNTWAILRQIDISENRIVMYPSIGNLILLAHSSNTPTLSTLETFLPVMLTSIQTNTALAETLALLLSTLGPLHTQIPRPTLSPDIAVPLAHILPHLAAAHPDADMRHISFRVLGLVLALAPALLQLQLLGDMLADPDTPAQMHVSGVSLVKEAVLEGLSRDEPSPFASPAFMDVFSSLLFRPNLPEARDIEQSLQEFLESPEPSRLVEALGLLFVLLRRDATNRTGVRSSDALRIIRSAFLMPIKEHLEAWGEVDLEESEEAGMQMRILEMWVQRVLDTVKGIEQGL